MTPEEIEYVREWAASGNKPRRSWGVADAVGMSSVVIQQATDVLTSPSGQAGLVLNGLGLTVAAQAERIRELESAFAQACDVAVEAGSYVDEYSFQKWLADDP